MDRTSSRVYTWLRASNFDVYLVAIHKELRVKNAIVAAASSDVEIRCPPANAELSFPLRSPLISVTWDPAYAFP